MPQAVLKTMLEGRWHGAAVNGRSLPLAGWQTGIPSVDMVLGPLGIPQGRLTEIFGADSSGKTSLAHVLLARCTATGHICAVVDAENAFFAPAAAAGGIDLDRLILVRPRQKSALLRAADALTRSGACAVVVLDSGSDAALQTHHCARLVAQAEKTSTTLLAISRGRNAALASFATLRLRACGVSPVWQSGDDGGALLLGYHISMEIAKARTVAPGKVFSFPVYVRGTASFADASGGMLLPTPQPLPEAEPLRVVAAS